MLLLQVGALRERIDELSEDLELARVAAATAAAAATSTPTAADGTLASNRSSAAGPAAPATGDGSDRQQWEQEEEQRPRSPGCELSERELAPVRQVPLMADNTPLEALHAQVGFELHMHSCTWRWLACHLHYGRFAACLMNLAGNNLQ